MIFAKPFPDELASYHLKRILAINDYRNNSPCAQADILAQATRHLRTTDEHPWTGTYTHEILAYLSAMTPAHYRTRHTLLALSTHWDTVYSHLPVQETKVDVYTLAAFYSNSEAENAPYRFCLQCRNEDLHRYDMAYLHRQHHLPGVDICPLPRTALCYVRPSSLNKSGNNTKCVPASLIDAQRHPILERYRTLVCRALENSHRLQYAHAGEKLLERAHDLKLCRSRLAYGASHYCLEHELPQFIYRHLPTAWLNHHFGADHTHYALRIAVTPERWHYHYHLEHLAYPTNNPPVYLLLTLAALFESVEDVCTFLFRNDVTTTDGNGLRAAQLPTPPTGRRHESMQGTGNRTNGRLSAKQVLNGRMADTAGSVITESVRHVPARAAVTVSFVTDP